MDQTTENLPKTPRISVRKDLGEGAGFKEDVGEGAGTSSEPTACTSLEFLRWVEEVEGGCIIHDDRDDEETMEAEEALGEELDPESELKLLAESDHPKSLKMLSTEAIDLSVAGGSKLATLYIRKPGVDPIPEEDDDVIFVPQETSCRLVVIRKVGGKHRKKVDGEVAGTSREPIAIANTSNECSSCTEEDDSSSTDYGDTDDEETMEAEEALEQELDPETELKLLAQDMCMSVQELQDLSNSRRSRRARLNQPKPLNEPMSLMPKNPKSLKMLCTAALEPSVAGGCQRGDKLAKLYSPKKYVPDPTLEEGNEDIVYLPPNQPKCRLVCTGNEFQADVPDAPSRDYHLSGWPEVDVSDWKPNPELPDHELNEYLNTCRAIQNEAIGTLRSNYLSSVELEHLTDGFNHNEDIPEALKELKENGYDIEQAGVQFKINLPSLMKRIEADLISKETFKELTSEETFKDLTSEETFKDLTSEESFKEVEKQTKDCYFSMVEPSFQGRYFQRQVRVFYRREIVNDARRPRVIEEIDLVSSDEEPANLDPNEIVPMG